MADRTAGDSEERASAAGGGSDAEMLLAKIELGNDHG
jgi:hypothetical protein